MDIFAFPPIAAALSAAYSLVAGLASLLTPATAGGSAALAIVIVTLLLRSLLIPVGRSQVKAQADRQRIAPQLAALQKKYRNNREVLLRKTQELYASEKVSPLAGLLPTLIQAPVISLVYGLFVRPKIGGHTNALLTQHLFGVPLGTSLFAAGWPGVAVFVALLVVIGVVATFARRTALAAPAAPGATDAQLRMVRILSWTPYLTLVFAAFVPLAATLYLAVTTTWTQVERAILRRRYLPPVPLVVRPA